MPTVEGVQDIVEQQLIFKKFPATAKAYILYREKHAEMRAFVTASSLGLVDNYLSELDWQVKENSNMGYSLQGMNNYIFSEVSKTYWLNKVYPPNIKRRLRARRPAHPRPWHALGVLRGLGFARFAYGGLPRRCRQN